MKKQFNIPDEFNLKIKEIYNNVYEIELSDKQNRKVVKQGENLENLINQMLADLINMRKLKKQNNIILTIIQINEKIQEKICCMPLLHG